MRRGVAVVGAGGFVGSRLLELAAILGRDDLVPIVRAHRGIARTAHLGVAHRIADASRREELERSLVGCEVVVNLTMGEASAIEGITRTVYEASRAVGARLLIHLSSAVVYGTVNRSDLPDDAPPLLDHWMAYARAKGKAENYLRSRMADDRLTVVVLRPSLIWGPGSPWVLGPGVALRQGAAYLVGGGDGVCDLKYVDDLAHDILAVASHDSPVPGFFHAADPETRTWREYYDELAIAIDADPGKIHRIPAAPYRVTLRDRLNAVRALPVYGRLKDAVSPELRASIKRRLAGERNGRPDSRPAAPVVDRAMWDLQMTRYPRPTGKFASAFGDVPRTSFATGVARSGAWLRFLGVG